MITIYVSPTGDDRWSGSSPEGADRRGPVRTPRRARDLLRGLRGVPAEAGGTAVGPAAGSPPAARVILRGGTYRLDETLVLGQRDGGTEQAAVTWEAFPGEQPVISGNRAVTGWQRWRDGLLRAPLPRRACANGMPRQLFYQGARLPRARWPKFDPANPIAGGWIIPEGPVEDREYLALRWPEGALPRTWAKPWLAEANIYGGWGWCNHLIPIAEIDRGERTLRLAHEPIREDFQPWYFDLRFSEQNRFFVENIPEECSEPGEWCCDPEEGWVCLRPPAGFDPSAVEIPALDCLVSVRGVRQLTLRGIAFTGTTTGDDYHRMGVMGVGAMMPQQGWRYCGEALHLRSTAHCAVEACRFDQVGGNAVYLERDALRCSVRGCEVAGSGANGIVLAGDRAFHPLFCEVTDNDVHHVGALINLTAGVFLGLSDGCLVAHNSLHDLPHHGVSLGSNGLGRNYVEYNDIRRVCQANADTGAINCWMDVPFPWVEPDAERSGHVIRWNRIEDVPGYRVERGRVIEDATSRGIYLDDLASGCVVSGNLVIRAGMGFQIHGGKHNLVENNVFVDCRHVAWICAYVSERPGMKQNRVAYRCNRIEGNIFSSSRSDAFGYWIHDWDPLVIGSCDRNLYFTPASREPWIRWDRHPDGLAGSTYVQWLSLGFDGSSRRADPRFTAPDRGDWSLAADSPAFGLGFQPLPLERVGIRPAAPEAIEPRRPAPGSGP